MTTAARVSQRVLLCLLAVLLTVLLVGGWITSPTAARADDGPMVTITLTSLTPATIPTDPEAVVQITGVVQNSSPEHLTQVQVSMWRSTDPISDAEGLAQVADSPWDMPLGQRLTTEDPTKNLFNITTDAEPTFAPGEKATFTVSAKVKHLTLGTAPGVRLLGVHVRAFPENGIKRTVGRARAFVPMTSAQSVPVASVVVLASRPSMVAPATFVDDHLAGELAGRLRDLTKLARERQATVLVDPSLIDEVRQMAKGYTLTSGQRPSAGVTNARTWLKDFEALQTQVAMYRLPYGNPNLVAAAQTGATDVLAMSTSALPKTHELVNLPLAVMGPNGVADERFVDFVKPLKPQLLVTSLPGIPARSSVQGIATVNADPGLFIGGPGPAPRASGPQIRGRLLSELRFNHSRGAAILFQSVDARVALLQQAGTAIRPASIEALRETGETPLPPAVDRPAAPSSVSERASSLRRAWSSWGELTGTQTVTELTAAQVSSRALSSSFGWHWPAVESFLTAAAAKVPSTQRANVQIVSTKSFVVNAPKTPLPITIRNNTDQTVKVRIVFRSENPQRISFEPTDVVTIPPKSSKSVNFVADAHTNGAVNVRADLQGPDGTPVGNSQNFTVSATSLGSVGWLIMLASGVTVIGATGLRIRQVQRERAKAALEAEKVAADPVLLDTSVDLRTRPHP